MKFVERTKLFKLAQLIKEQKIWKSGILYPIKKGFLETKVKDLKTAPTTERRRSVSVRLGCTTVIIDKACEVVLKKNHNLVFTFLKFGKIIVIFLFSFYGK